MGHANLVLLGRRPPRVPEASAIRALEAQGARVEAVSLDVADLAALRAAFARVGRHPATRYAAIVHCAGVLDDALLADQSWPRFAGVMSPKIAGAANLDALTRDRTLDFFVLFSSSSSLLGSPGQANYAAANAWMDALAHRRRAEGLARHRDQLGTPGASVGMAARLDEATRRRQAEWGLGVIPLDEGLKALASPAGPRRDPGRRPPHRLADPPSLPSASTAALVRGHARRNGGDHGS